MHNIHAICFPIPGGPLTGKVSAAGKEGLDVVLVEAVVLQHPVEPLQILNVMLECYLLLPATYKKNTDTHLIGVNNLMDRYWTIGWRK